MWIFLLVCVKVEPAHNKQGRQRQYDKNRLSSVCAHVFLCVVCVREDVSLCVVQRFNLMNLELSDSLY